MAPGKAERIELARRGVQMYDAGDVEGALALMHPAIEGYSEGLNTDHFSGIDGFLAWAAEWDEAWGRFDREVREVEAVGEQHAVAIVEQSGIGRDSGVAVEQTAAYVFEVDDDMRCTYFALYIDPERGLAAAREREGLGP